MKTQCTILLCALLASCGTPRLKTSATGSAAGACDLTKGSVDETILAGNFILNDGKMASTAVYIKGGKIEAIGIKVLLLAGASAANFITCKMAPISQVLSNPPEHNAEN